MTEETKLFIQESEMPASCSDCLLLYDNMECIITGENIWMMQKMDESFNEEEERLPNCPLRSLESLYERAVRKYDVD